MNINKIYIYAAVAGVVSVLTYIASGGSLSVTGLAGAAVAAIGVIESSLGHESTAPASS